MSEQHPITPPPELLKQWVQEVYGLEGMPGPTPGKLPLHVATQAARWGADVELEACCAFLYDNELCDPNFYQDLRAARRPKPPSLKEQALKILDLGHGLADCDRNTLRRALEALPDD